MDTAESNPTIKQLQQSVEQLNRELTRTRQKVYAMGAAGKLARHGKRPRLPLEFTSQFGEDMLVWDLLGGQTEGFFIEAGAFDGYRYSVTYPFEAIGWNGLLVEPHPEAFVACRERRSNSRVVNAALSRRGAAGEAQFTVMKDFYGGMLSYHKPTDENLALNYERRVVSVALTSLDALLEDHRGPVDLAVIDVEGAEGDILDGFDLARFRPRLLLIEDNHDPAVEAHMSRFAYVRVGRLQVNVIYVHREEREILERCRWVGM